MVMVATRRSDHDRCCFFCSFQWRRWRPAFRLPFESSAPCQSLWRQSCCRDWWRAFSSRRQPLPTGPRVEIAGAVAGSNTAHHSAHCLDFATAGRCCEAARSDSAGGVKWEQPMILNWRNINYTNLIQLDYCFDLIFDFWFLIWELDIATSTSKNQKEVDPLGTGDGHSWWQWLRLGNLQNQLVDGHHCNGCAASSGAIVGSYADVTMGQCKPSIMGVTNKIIEKTMLNAGTPWVQGFDPSHIVTTDIWPWQLFIAWLLLWSSTCSYNRIIRTVVISLVGFPSKGIIHQRYWGLLRSLRTPTDQRMWVCKFWYSRVEVTHFDKETAKWIWK